MGSVVTWGSANLVLPVKTHAFLGQVLVAHALISSASV